MQSTVSVIGPLSFDLSPRCPWYAYLSIPRVYPDDPHQVTEAPVVVLQALQDIRRHSLDGRSAVTISQQINVEDTIPLAAVLLEYPVAYVPTSPVKSSFLNGEALIVYECCLEQISSSPLFQHTLIKFSCPERIVQEMPHLSPQRLVQRLQEHFAPRIRVMDETISLKIQVSTERLDRVAL